MGMVLLNESYDMETIKLICRYLKRGYCILVRTDTQWGLMALDPTIIYEIKRRPAEKKLIKLVSPRYLNSMIYRSNKNNLLRNSDQVLLL